MSNYLPEKLQQMIDKIYVEVDIECTLNEDYDECYKIIEKGQEKINELLTQK